MNVILILKNRENDIKNQNIKIITVKGGKANSNRRNH